MSDAQEERLGRGGRRGGKRGGANAGDDDRPKTAGRGRGRGRGAPRQAAADDDNDVGAGRGRRPQTARQAADAAEGVHEESKGPRGGDRRNNDQRRGGNRQQQAEDKNSWKYKFHNMDRPQYEKIAFTADTPIPELPAKKDLLKEPQNEEFKRQMAAQDDLIQQKRNQKDQLIKQRRTVREGGFASSGDKTKKGVLTERINAAKGVKNNKRQNQDAMREIVQQI